MTNREIDALVAEKVMALSNIKSCESGLVYSHDGYHPFLVPRYSECIAAAWEVVEKLKFWTMHRWESCTRFIVNTDTETFEAIEETAPLAICKAALKAMGVV